MSLALFPTRMKTKGPFIGDQRLRLLTCDDESMRHRQWECLDPDRFRVARRAVEDDGSVDGNIQLPKGWRWELIDTKVDREKLLVDPKHNRLVLVIEAGTGKTIATQQAAYLRSSKQTGHLVLGFPFARLPDDAAKYLDDTQSPWLCQRMCDLPQFRGKEFERVRRLILRQINTGKFTLMVDALDQQRRVDSPQRRVDALAGFLQRFPKTNVIVTGRPTSIVDQRDTLFAGDDWSFVQISEFTKEQCKEYVGVERIKALGRLDVELMSQPRMLEQVRELTPDELRGTRTASELHWRALEKTLVIAVSEYNLSTAEPLKLLAAIAFQMHSQQNTDGVPAGAEFETFVDKMHEDRGKALAKTYPTPLDLYRGIDNVAKLNEFLDFAVLEASGRTQIYFRNRTLQDFFAALWVTRYASGVAERNWLRENLLDYTRKQPGLRQRTQQFWRFATEIPSAAYGDGQHWARSMSVLFLPNRYSGNDDNDRYDLDDQPESTIGECRRSPQYVYRAWWNLLDLAGKLPIQSPYGGEYLVEEDLIDATTQVQAEVRCRFDKGERMRSLRIQERRTASETAGSILDSFLGEFLELTQKSDTAREFDSDFCEIPEGNFYYGNDGDVDTLAEGFILARFPVANQIITLFCPRHLIIEFDYEDSSSSPTCPAIYCDWYTAWCAATWLHGRLPGERQWERACRGSYVSSDPPTRFNVGDTENDLVLAGWYQENSRRHTHPIGGETESKRPNDFGIYHMHGSVWECTQSCYGNPSPKSRVLRGGAFNVNSVGCQSSFRESLSPDHAIPTVGFRVARA